VNVGLALAIAYIAGFIAWSVSWAMAADRARCLRDREGLRTAARMVFLSPVWPVMAVLMAVFGLVGLWRDADWRRR
jgi:hypothetical protein